MFKRFFLMVIFLSVACTKPPPKKVKLSREEAATRLSEQKKELIKLHRQEIEKAIAENR
jgi:hypothetical protein